MMQRKILSALAVLLFAATLYAGVFFSNWMHKSQELVTITQTYRTVSRQENAVLYVAHEATVYNEEENTLRYLAQETKEQSRKKWEAQEAEQKAKEATVRAASIQNTQGRKNSGASVSSGTSSASTSAGQSDGVITAEPGVSSRLFSRAQQIYQSLPSGVRNVFEKDGWRIVISGEKLSKRFGYSYSIAGLTISGEKTVYLDNRESAINKALIHEIGHAIDAWSNFPSQNPAFAQLMRQETLYTPDGDGRGSTNARECFANAFQYMMQYGNQYESYSPRIYEFVRRYIP